MVSDIHALIAKALTGLVKQIKAVRYYPPRHPALNATAVESLKSIKPLLDGTRHFSLTVRKEAFLYDGQPVGKGQQLLTQFATFCFARRIQTLTLLPELGAVELHHFIQFLVIDPQELQRRGGLQALLEKAHITNIWLNEQDLNTILEKKQEIEAQPRPDEDAIAALVSETTPEKAQPNQDVQSLRTILKRLEQERDDQRFWNLLQEVIPLLRLSMAENNRGIILHAFVLICRFASEKSSSDARREHSMNALRQLATPEMIDFLVASLLSAGATEKARNALVRVLAFLEEKSTRRIMDILAGEKIGANRKLLASTLILAGTTAVPVLQEYLFDDRWYVVRNAVVILGEIRHQESLIHLTPLLQHKDIRVRRETIRAMTKIGGQRAINILLQATTSNDQELRRQALLSLGAIRASSAVPTLLKIIKKSGWSQNTVDLKKDAIRSLAEIRSTDAVPALEKIVAMRSFFHRKSCNELRVAAASALGDIGDESAFGALDKATHDKSPIVVRAAYQALKQLTREHHES